LRILFLGLHISELFETSQTEAVKAFELDRVFTDRGTYKAVVVLEINF
jgi:hypothetical protein